MESGVLEGDIQTGQCRGGSRTGLGSTAVESWLLMLLVLFDLKTNK